MFARLGSRTEMARPVVDPATGKRLSMADVVLAAQRADAKRSSRWTRMWAVEDDESDAEDRAAESAVSVPAASLPTSLDADEPAGLVSSAWQLVRRAAFAAAETATPAPTKDTEPATPAPVEKLPEPRPWRFLALARLAAATVGLGALTSAQAEAEAEEPFPEGTLMKLSHGRIIQRYQPRHFVVDMPYLHYSRDEASAVTGIIELVSVTSVLAKGADELVLQTEDRVYRLKAATTDERDAWTSASSGRAAGARRRGPQGGAQGALLPRSRPSPREGVPLEACDRVLILKVKEQNQRCFCVEGQCICRLRVFFEDLLGIRPPEARLRIRAAPGRLSRRRGRPRSARRGSSGPERDPPGEGRSSLADDVARARPLSFISRTKATRAPRRSTAALLTKAARGVSIRSR